MIPTDCYPGCCATAAPVNVIGSPGQTGAAGLPGALILLGTISAPFYPAQTIQIPLLSASGIPISAYIVKEVIVIATASDLNGAVFCIYDTVALSLPIIAVTTINTGFVPSTWRTFPPAGAAAAGQNVLTGPIAYLNIATQSNAAGSIATVNIYGYAL